MLLGVLHEDTLSTNETRVQDPRLRLQVINYPTESIVGVLNLVQVRYEVFCANEKVVPEVAAGTAAAEAAEDVGAGWFFFF